MPKNLMLSLSKHAVHTLALRQAQGEGVFGVRTRRPPVMAGLDPAIHVFGSRSDDIGGGGLGCPDQVRA